MFGGVGCCWRCSCGAEMQSLKRLRDGGFLNLGFVFHGRCWFPEAFIGILQPVCQAMRNRHVWVAVPLGIGFCVPSGYMALKG